MFCICELLYYISYTTCTILYRLYIDVLVIAALRGTMYTMGYMLYVYVAFVVCVMYAVNGIM